MSPRKQIPSLSLIHIGLLPSRVPFLHLSFVLLLHPFPSAPHVRSDRVHPGMVNKLLGCSTTTASRVMSWDDLLSLRSFTLSLSERPCFSMNSNYGTWRTWNLSLRETALLVSLNFPLGFSSIFKSLKSRLSLIFSIIPSWPTPLVYPVISTLNYYLTTLLALSHCLDFGSLSA